MLLSAREAAERIGRKCARTILRRPIPRVREGRQWKFDPAAVDAYVKKQTLHKSSRVSAVAPPSYESFSDIAA